MAWLFAIPAKRANERRDVHPIGADELRGCSMRGSDGRIIGVRPSCHRIVSVINADEIAPSTARNLPRDDFRLEGPMNVEDDEIDRPV